MSFCRIRASIDSMKGQPSKQKTGTMSGKENRSDLRKGSSGPRNGGNAGIGEHINIMWNKQLVSLQGSLFNLWSNGIGTDAVLLCQGVPLQVHKIVLTAASPYVASVIQTIGAASHMMPVIVVDIPSEAGKALLTFLYCGEAKVPVTIIPHLITGAKFLGIPLFDDPGVLESLKRIVPESFMTPNKTTAASCDTPQQKPLLSPESPSRPHFKVPTLPVRFRSSARQINSSSGSKINFSNSGKKPDLINSSEVSSKDLPQHMLQFNQPHQLITMGKNRDSRIVNPTMNISTSTGNISTCPTKSGVATTITGNKSLKHPISCAGGNSHGDFVGRSRSLDMFKKPKIQLEEGKTAAAAVASADPRVQTNGGNGEGKNHMKAISMTGEQTSISGHLLQPNVVYRVPQEHADRCALSRNPWDKKNVALIKYRGGRLLGMVGIKKNQQLVPMQQAAAGNDIHDISSAGRLANNTPGANSKMATRRRKPDSVICEKCGKKFCNAHNYRVHMEGHIKVGQMFQCHLCKHASISREGLRKHVSYRHRESWMAGVTLVGKVDPEGKRNISNTENSHKDAVNNEGKGETLDACTNTSQ